MNKLVMTSIFIGATLASCASTTTYTNAEIQEICEEARAEAAGVQGSVSMGVNSVSGTQLGVALSVNDKYIRGVDPQAAYDQCVQKYNDINAKALASQAR